MRKYVFLTAVLGLSLILFTTCSLFGEDENFDGQPSGLESNVTPYKPVTLQDIEDVDNHYGKYSDYDKAEEMNDDLNLYIDFIQASYDYLIILFDQYTNGSADLYSGSRSIETTVSVFVDDDEFTVESDQYDDNINYYTLKVDHFDVVIQGTTKSSLADIIEQESDLPEESSLLVELSTFVKTSAEHNLRKAFSIYGYLESSSTAEPSPGISGMLNASFGSRIFSSPEDTTYAGKIYAQFSIKEFVDVPPEDFVAAVDLITGLGDSSTAIADWNDATDLLWGSTSSPYISLTLGVGDNDGIIEATTYTDLEVLEMIGNV